MLLKESKKKLILLFSRFFRRLFNVFSFFISSFYDSAISFMEFYYPAIVKMQKTLKLLYTFNDDTLRFAFHFSSHLTLISISSCILIQEECLGKLFFLSRRSFYDSHYHSLFSIFLFNFAE